MKRIILSILGIATITTASAVVGGTQNVPASQLKSKPSIVSKVVGYDFYFNYGRGVSRVDFYNTYYEEGCAQGSGLSLYGNYQGHLHIQIPVTNCYSAQPEISFKNWLINDRGENRPANIGSSWRPNSALTSDKAIKFTAKDLFPLSPANTDVFVSGKLYINGSPMNGDFALVHTNMPAANSHDYDFVTRTMRYDSVWAWSARNDEHNINLSTVCSAVPSACENTQDIVQKVTPHAIHMSHAAHGEDEYYVTGDEHSLSYTYVTFSTEDGSRYIAYPVYDSYSLMIDKIK
ncbi:MAG: hypothetical protein PHC75_02615 [Burkholderiales bacterium]|nr:hypothetical protein [Burkholderiales bacterium]